MDRFRLDPDKVASSRLKGEAKSLGFLTKEAYDAYSDSVKKHETAKKLIEDSGKYVDAKGNPNSIDKGLFERDLTLSYPGDNAEIPSSSQ